MHLCFWLFLLFFFLKSANNPIIWNRSIFLVSLAKEFSFLWLLTKFQTTQEREEKFDFLEFIEFKSDSCENNEAMCSRDSWENLFSLQHITDEFHFACSFSLPLGPPSHETKNVHILIGVTHTRIKFIKKSLNLFVRIAGIMMMKSSCCFCCCSVWFHYTQRDLVMPSTKWMKNYINRKNVSFSSFIVITSLGASRELFLLKFIWNLFVECQN